MNTRIAHPVNLPSRGLPYDGKLPDGKVELLPLRVAEQKQIAGLARGKPRAAWDMILRSCVKTEGWVDMELGDLTASDQMYLLVFIRVLSFGDERNLKITCQGCGSSFPHIINLRELDVQTLGDDFAEPFEIDLPMSKQRVGLRLLRGRDLDEIDRLASQRRRESEKMLARNPRAQLPQGDQMMPYRIAQQVATIDGEEVPDREKIAWAEELIAGDNRAIGRALDENDSGIIMDYEVNCPRCGATTEISLVSDAHGFFLPD